MSIEEDVLVEKYSKSAIAWDEWYIKLYNLTPYKNAVRVEQGEYAVVSRNKPLGTYSVLQCVSLYLATEEMHGLAHVDGHTEIKSLKDYRDALNIPANKLTQVKIIGSSSKEIMGLNNSEENIKKIALFLETLVSKEDATSYIENRDLYINFVIEYPGTIKNNFLPLGKGTKEQALHTIQEIKRNDGFSGTYPIIRANDGHSRCIFLDERAIVKLNEYAKDINKDKKQRSESPNPYLGNPDAFDNSIPIILNEWKKIISGNILTTTPLFIGDEANNLNQKEVSPAKTYINSANISTVLEYCNIVDTQLNVNIVKEALQKQFKLDFDCNILAYDAGINADSLLTSISECSPILKKLILLNSQRTYNPHKVQDIKEVLSEAELLLLNNIISDKNLELLNAGRNSINEENFAQHFNLQLNLRAVTLSRREKIALDQKKMTHQNLCEKYHLDFSQVNQSIKKQYKVSQQIKTKITDHSEFSGIQSDLLIALGLTNFSDTSIGMHLSKYADNFSCVYDENFGEKVAAIIGDCKHYLGLS